MGGGTIMDMRKKLQESVMSVPDLPAGFTELEYLEGSGTQWINTGKSIYGWSSNVGVETRFVIPGSEGHASFKIVVFGCRQASRVKNFEVSGYESGLVRWGTQHFPYCTLHMTNRGRDLVTDFTLHDKKSTWLLETGETSTQTLTEDPEWLDIPIYLFALNQNGQLSQCSLDKIYFFRLFNGQELAQELIPVLDENGVPCMYDKISQGCLYNSGTGTFGYKIKATGEVVAPK